MNEIDDKWTGYSRNVRDELKGLSTEEIRQQLQNTAFPFAVMMSQLAGDFNFSSVVRSANSFNAKEIFYFGKKKYDRRGSVGSHNYCHVNFLKSMDDIIELKKKYTFVALENVPGSVSLPTYSWKSNSLIILGEESLGLSEEILELADDIVEIPSYGSIRSLNAASAATVAMYDFVAKFRT